MKNHSARYFSLAMLAASLAPLALTSCSKSDRTDARAAVKDAYQDSNLRPLPRKPLAASRDAKAPRPDFHKLCQRPPAPAGRN